MKYSFETSEQIIDCLDCPFYDPQLDENDIYKEHDWQCWVNKRILKEPLAGKPKWCPLKMEVEI